MKTKTKRKIFPANTSDIPAIESWLEDLALEGLFPISFNGYYGKFRQDTPQKLAYRIEIPEYFDTVPPRAMRETYEEFGWQFVTTMWQKYYLFANSGEAPVEPHTDPVAQAGQYKEALQEQRRLVFSGLVVGLVFLGIAVAIVYNKFALFVTNTTAWWPLLLLALAVGGIAAALYELRTLSRMEQSLSLGIPMEHRKDYRFGRWAQLGLLLLLLLMNVGNVYRAGADSLRTKQIPLREISTPLPCLPFAEIDSSAEPGGTASFHHAPFAPVQYQVWQYGAGESYLQSWYVQLRPGFLAAPTMRSMVQELQSYPIAPMEWETLEVSAEAGVFDEVLYTQSGNTAILAVRKNDTAFCLEYYGDADLSAYLPEIAALLERRYAPLEK